MPFLRTKHFRNARIQRRWHVAWIALVLVVAGFSFWPHPKQAMVTSGGQAEEVDRKPEQVKDSELQIGQIAMFPNVTRVVYQDLDRNHGYGHYPLVRGQDSSNAPFASSIGNLPFGYPASQHSAPVGSSQYDATGQQQTSIRPTRFDAGVAVGSRSSIRPVFGYQEMEPLPAPQPSRQPSAVTSSDSFSSTVSPSEVTYQVGANYHFDGAMAHDASNGTAAKSIMAVDGFRRRPRREPRWSDAELLPWESLAYGEYIGPARTPHMREYRIRVGDELDFTFRQTRDIIQQPYRLGVGDVISITANGEYQTDFGDDNLTVLRDGTIQVKSLGSVHVANKTLARLQEELNQMAVDEGPAQESPNIIIKVLKSETELNDLIRTVDATAGQGGQFRSLTVSPDGTVQLPALGSVPAIGLTLDELGAEANARYAMMVQGLEVTPSLRQPAPSFAYVLGEANNPGRIQIQGPTTVMQLVAQAGGWRSGANLREIVVFRRDENWQLIATKLDLSAPMWGNRPHPSDDLWVRNNDIILLPKTPAQRVVDFIEIYFTRGLYGVLPSQGFSVNFDGVSSL